MTALHLARPQDMDRLLPMVTAFQEELGIDLAPDTRHAGLAPLLEGSPHGVAYLIGPQRAPIGYVVICFGWSLEFGGMDGFVDEIYIRPGVRGRGIGSEVLTSLPKALSGAGLKALHLEVRRDDANTRRLYERLRFRPREDYMLMTLRP
ncbi:GNAT family N-acetyltransferase [Thalassovita sp.]|uniref:GNAT family N-acetyltransferase n=1 Tax=Thalassovita sp. TaxID=1979401 RepID=UPI002880D10A|nr:GNAT family N-acetyltransferase [Thalassovita sp.]MDF1803893.1 GNAT family N-acetyltransferase [Thalassovita sp.]